jgi:hypothetical protein
LSDLALGALIGVGGTIIGALIAGMTSYIITRMQINARRYDLRFESLITDRKIVLIPLREAVSKSLELSNNALTMTVRLGEANKRGADAKELREEIQLWEEVSEKSSQASSNLEILRGQISDSKLDQFIQEAISAQREESTELAMITHRAQQPENWTKEAFDKIVNDREEILKRLRSKLFTVNKRIEELLSGEPSG